MDALARAARKRRATEGQLRLQLAELNRELQCQSDRSRKRQRPIATRLCKRIWRIAATIRNMPAGSVLLSRLYIYWHVKRCLKRSWNGVQGVTDASIDNAIQEVHDQNADRLRMVMEDVQCDEYFRAARWCAEQKAFMWLVQSNVRGASPSTAELFHVFADSFPAISRGGRFVEFVSIGESKYRLNRWGGIFRRRWSVHYEGLPKANALTDAELSERAAP